MKIKSMPLDSRPREKLKKYGVENLSNAELLAIILRTGIKNENVIDMSNRLIQEYGIDKISECSLKELQEIKGIGIAKACQILASFELNKRKEYQKNEVRKISCSNDVFNLLHEKLKDKKQEVFLILMLDNKNKILGLKEICIGILDASIIHPREIFKPAIKNSASKIILVHNHPSGDPNPSNEDIEVTEQLKKAGEEIGIPILDHIIIGRDCFWSWKEKG